jgi:hypothetical protein
MDRRKFLQTGVALGAIASSGASASHALSNSMQNDRDYWVQSMLKIADPVLRALSDGKLRERMPVEAPHGISKTASNSPTWRRLAAFSQAWRHGLNPTMGRKACSGRSTRNYPAAPFAPPLIPTHPIL